MPQPHSLRKTEDWPQAGLALEAELFVPMGSTALQAWILEALDLGPVVPEAMASLHCHYLSAKPKVNCIKNEILNKLMVTWSKRGGRDKLEDWD